MNKQISYHVTWAINAKDWAFPLAFGIDKGFGFWIQFLCLSVVWNVRKENKDEN